VPVNRYCWRGIDWHYDWSRGRHCWRNLETSQIRSDLWDSYVNL